MNRMRHVFMGIGAALSLGIGATAIAHHGWSSYESEIQKLDGVIEESSYVSPHGSIRLKAGDSRTWLVVLAPPSRMTNRAVDGKTVELR